MHRPALNVPNQLALARIVLTPVVMAFILLSDQIDHAFGIALAVFIPAALTDFADGYLARRWKITTVLGAFLDSVADKVLVVGSLLVLIEVGRAWSSGPCLAAPKTEPHSKHSFQHSDPALPTEWAGSVATDHDLQHAWAAVSPRNQRLVLSHGYGS